MALSISLDLEWLVWLPWSVKSRTDTVHHSLWRVIITTIQVLYIWSANGIILRRWIGNDFCSYYIARQCLDTRAAAGNFKFSDDGASDTDATDVEVEKVRCRYDDEHTLLPFSGWCKICTLLNIFARSSPLFIS